MQLTNFPQQPEQSDYKTRIARQFSRAASAYDGAADVQLDIGLDNLHHLGDGYQRLLDIGCGTGRITRRLAPACEHLLALDLAEGMLGFARQQLEDGTQAMPASGIDWIAGDAESLPLANCSVDGIFSSMALQWCRSLPLAMDELFRVLRPGGKAMLAVLCDGSMAQLSHCWQRLDHQPHVNQFSTTDSMQQAAHQAGFSVSVWQKSYLTWHNNVRDLLGSIKAIGANVVTETGNHAPINRAMLQRLQLCYQAEHGQLRQLSKLNSSIQLPLTYQVCFLQLEKI